MITNKQLDRICDLLVDYRKAIVELTTAAPEDRMAAAYEFAAIDQMVHEMLASWVEPEDTKTKDDGWIEWGGGAAGPVNSDVTVEARWSDGSVTSGEASEWRWQHFGGSNPNLIAYRVVS